MDQAKSQWAAGEVAAVISFQLTSLLSRDQTSPSSPSPASGVFSQHLSGTRKDRACQNQGSVFNIIKTAVKTVNITQNQREEMRTSLEQVWGEETDPTLLSTIPGGYRNPLVFALGAQAAETWGPNQGSCDPWCWDLGLCGSHPFHVGQDPVYTETTCLLFTCCVSCLLRDSQHLN